MSNSKHKLDEILMDIENLKKLQKIINNVLIEVAHFDGLQTGYALENLNDEQHKIRNRIKDLEDELKEKRNE